MLNPNWTMKVEYLHFDFTNFDNTWNDSSVTNFKVTHGDLTIDTVKLGFNYILNHGYAPLK
jgi:opacity protein-like surface antigen